MSVCGYFPRVKKQRNSIAFKVTRTLIISFLLCTDLIATSQSFPVDYESDEVTGNAINARRIESDRDDYQDYGTYNYVTSKRGPEVFVGVHKKNVISALQAKMRRSKMNDVEDKLKFAPVLSVGEFNLKMAAN